MEPLNKEAQARKLRHKARRGVNLTGKALEALNSEYRAVVGGMNKLDEEIRKDAENLKIITEEARSLARRRDYFAAAAAVSQFHEKAKIINARLTKFSLDLKRNHQRFLLKNLSPLDTKRLMEYDPNKEVKFDENRQIIREAGRIADWWHNIFNQKGKAMKALESKFSSSFITNLKEATREIVRETEETFGFLEELFNELGYAWGSRNVGEYVTISEKFTERYRVYHSAYLSYHNKYIVPLQAEQTKMLEEEKAEAAKAQQAATPQAPPGPMPPVPDLAVPPPRDTQRDLQPPSMPSVPELPQSEPTLPLITKKPMPFGEENEPGYKYTPQGYRKAHQGFIMRLEKLGSPAEIVQEILNYSEALEDVSPEESLKLLSIAEGELEKSAVSYDQPEEKLLPGMEPPKKKDQSAPVPKTLELVEDMEDEEEPQFQALHQPIQHNIPRGIVNQKWDTIPFLAQIPKDGILMSAEVQRRNIINVNVVLARRKLPIIQFVVGNSEEGIRLNEMIINAIHGDEEQEMPSGLLMTNLVCGKGQNPHDCELLVGGHFKLSFINPDYRGRLKFEVACRLNTTTGSISTSPIRDIQVV